MSGPDQPVNGEGKDVTIPGQVMPSPDSNAAAAGNDGLHRRPTAAAAGSDVEAQALVDANAAPKLVEEKQVDAIADVSYLDIAKQFSILGWTAFGGPAAHIGLMQRRLVDKFSWMTNEVYGELFALGQCMPGPTSTQVSFSIGIIKKGAPGGLMSGALFQYPGAIIMTAIGVAFAKALQDPAGWLNGFIMGVSSVGVALVASAAKGMAGKLCATPITSGLATFAAVLAYYWPKPYTFPCVIIFSGIVTFVWAKFKKQALPPPKEADESIKSHGLNMWAGGALLAAWVVVLVTTVTLAARLANPTQPLQWFAAFFRTGSIIYGGGQVVLPMLYNDVVQRTCVNGVCTDNPDTWVTSKQFYAGLGVVQALPGPLFNFAAYLGAIMAINAGYTFILGAVLAWFGLFGPGIMIIFGIMPFWGWFRNWSVYRFALPGLNAAGVGLIIASVFSLTFGVLQQTSHTLTAICIGFIAFTAVDQYHWFEPAVVIAGGIMGIIAWAAGML